MKNQSLFTGHCLIACLLWGAALLCSGPALAEDMYAPQRMIPNPIEQTFDAGRPDGMPLYPASPVPGHPGADPAAERNPWSHPQRLPYEGSVEHWRVWIPHYIQPIAPFNHRTLLRNFPAQEMDGVTAEMREPFAEPIEYVVRFGPTVRTGAVREPVPVVRLRPGGERLRFNLDPLPTGMYAVRLIAAIDPENVEPLGHHPNDMIVDMTINDGPLGEMRHYALRQRGTDNFYSMGEFFFHVEDARSWEITLGVHADSNIDLLVHNVDVHDMLAETAKRGGKTRSIHAAPETLKSNWASEEALKAREAHEQRMDRQILRRLKAIHPQLTDEEIRALWRSERDDALWLSLPPKNFNFYKTRGGPQIPSTPDPATAEALQKKGRLPRDNSGWFQVFSPDRPAATQFWGVAVDSPWRMVWYRGEDDIVEYTADDLLAHKPLPGFPFDVPPWGKSFELDNGQRALFFPITQAYNSAFRHAMDQVRRLSNAWVNHGIEDVAHDAAIHLARLAYDLPSYIESHAINDQFAHRGAYFNRVTSAHHFRRWSYEYIYWERLARAYDNLFAYIQGNQRLADSIGRHVKWVETPEDVITLLDTYLLQYGARESLYFRYYYNHQTPRMLANFVAIQTDAEITTPWVEALFERTWEYPSPIYASVEDFMYLATQRDGTSTMASSLYARHGSAVASAASLLDEYVADGGDARYQLADIRRYPRVAQFPLWLLESRIAGKHVLQVGTANGPNTAYGQWLELDSEQMNLGWRWTKDPRFAWVVANHGHRRSESDEQWAELLAAAATVKRDPFMSNRSRVLTDWGVYLEGNADSDDFQQRSGAHVRIGVGVGHEHADTLALNIWAYGLPIAPNLAHRRGYGRPCAYDSLTHNLVTIDKENWLGHGWAREIADLEGVQYTNTDTLRDSHYSRQIALVERPMPYVVDFARTIGGREHSYNFNGPTDDLWQTNLTPGVLSEADIAWMPNYVMEGEQWAADLDQNVFQATFRMAREPRVFTVPNRGQRHTRAPEPHILGKAYDENSPRKFLRVHLPGQQGLRVRGGVAVAAPYYQGRTDGEWLKRMHVIREVRELPASTLFAAVWEPFEGESFITDVRLEGDPEDATGFAAVHVQTKDGGNDIIFSDAVVPQSRTLSGDVTVDGRFAFVSRNGPVLQQASLVGGRRLALPELVIETTAGEHEARVTALDYLNNRATLDQPLSSTLTGRFFEVGTPADGARGARWSNFEVTQIEGDVLVWRKGADGGTGVIESIEPMSAILADGQEADQWYARGATDEHLLLTLRLPSGMPDGRNHQVALRRGLDGPLVSADVLTLADEDDREGAGGATQIGGRHVLLRAKDARRLGLAVEDRIRLYEIAIGDTFRTSSQVSLRRQDDGTYRVQADVPFTITVRSTAASYSTDGGATWQAMTDPGDGKRQWRLSQEDLDAGPLRIRW